jgi:hypothetical protein
MGWWPLIPLVFALIVALAYTKAAYTDHDRKRRGL